LLFSPRHHYKNQVLPVKRVQYALQMLTKTPMKIMNIW